MGTRVARVRNRGEDLPAVASEVADDDVKLCESEPQGFRLTVINLLYSLPGRVSPRLGVTTSMNITIPHRFRGPLTSANGGYAAGRLAAFVDADEVEVTLRLPPPLDRPLAVRREGDGAVVLLDGEAVVAEARPGHVSADAPAAVSFADAEDARARHVGVGNQVFRECFVCGTRDSHDGLEIHAGAVSGREPLHAAPWVVAEASPEIVWAAIDCPGAYAVGAEGRGEPVLGRMTARVRRVPDVGERCVVVAWPLGEDGRKLFAGTALLAVDGDLLAIARQTWIQPRS
jgi:hypothetical protein